VSLQATHSITLHKKESIQDVLQKHMESSDQQTFNLSLNQYDNGQTYVVGNAQLPVEDIIQLVSSQASDSFSLSSPQTLSRILMLYGTSHCERENLYIGKLSLNMSYHSVREYVQTQPDSQLDISQSMLNQAN